MQTQLKPGRERYVYLLIPIILLGFVVSPLRYVFLRGSGGGGEEALAASMLLSAPEVTSTPEITQQKVEAQPALSATAYQDGLSIIDVSQEVACAGGQMDRMQSISGIAVHHTANDNGRVGPYRLVQSWYNNKDSRHAPYHFLIANGDGVMPSGEAFEDGTVWQLQSLDYRSGHTKTPFYLYNYIAVAIDDDLNKRELTPKAHQSLVALLRWLCLEYEISPENILGHGEFDNTACPGNKVNMEEIKTAVTATSVVQPPLDGVRKDVVQRYNVRWEGKWVFPRITFDQRPSFPELMEIVSMVEENEGFPHDLLKAEAWLEHTPPAQWDEETGEALVEVNPPHNGYPATRDIGILCLNDYFDSELDLKEAEENLIYNLESGAKKIKSNLNGDPADVEVWIDAIDAYVGRGKGAATIIRQNLEEKPWESYQRSSPRGEVVWRFNALMFHGVGEGAGSISKTQHESLLLSLLDAGYAFITLDDLLAAFYEGKDLPPKWLILTYDDGRRDFYTYAYPFLKANNIPAVIFIPTQGRGLTDHQLQEIAREGLVTIGAHSRTHPHSSVLSSPNVPQATLENEILGSKQDLEAIIGQPVLAFCWPGGGHGSQSEAYAREVGFKLAFAVWGESTQTKENIFGLGRFNIASTADVESQIRQIESANGY